MKPSQPPVSPVGGRARASASCPLQAVRLHPPEEITTITNGMTMKRSWSTTVPDARRSAMAGRTSHTKEPGERQQRTRCGRNHH